MADETNPAATVAACRFCGEPFPGGDTAPSDWQCAKCGRYQDTTVCPTCRSIVRLSLLSDEARAGAIEVERAPASRRHR